MPQLCLKCHAEADGAECYYCAEETVWVRDIYEIKIGWTCDVCGSQVVKSYDCGNPEFPEELENKDTDMYCPNCQGMWIHKPEVLSSRPKLNPDVYLEKVFQEEIDVGRKKRRKSNWR